MKLRSAQIPEIVSNIFKSIDQAQEDRDDENYLVHFKRDLDPIIIGTFYGLYTSKTLPPLTDDRISLPNFKEFGGELSPYDELFNHFIFCLWLNKNGFPNESSDIFNYRNNLYEFLSYIINPTYYRDVLIPFYLVKASEDKEFESSFMYKIWDSGEIGFKNTENSPEFLCLTFNNEQEIFVEEIIKPLEGKISEMKKISQKIDAPIIDEKISENPTQYLNEFENDFRNFIKKVIMDKEGSNWWKRRIPGTIKENCRNRKKERESIPGAIETDYELIYYLDFGEYFEIIKQSNNWKEIFQPYFKDISWLYTKMNVELKPIRNDVAHNRQLSNENIQKLTKVIAEIRACMK